MKIDSATLITTLENQTRKAQPSAQQQTINTEATSSPSPAKTLAEKYDVRNMSPDDVWRMMSEGVADGVFSEAASGRWTLMGAPGDAVPLNDPGLHSREKTDVIEITSEAIEYNKSANNQPAVERYEALLSRLMMLDYLRGSDIPTSV